MSTMRYAVLAIAVGVTSFSTMSSEVVYKNKLTHIGNGVFATDVDKTTNYPIPTDAYTIALASMGMSVNGIDNRPLNPETGLFELGYEPPEQYINAIPVDNLVFTVDSIEGVHYKFLNDPYGFSTNEVDLANREYVVNQRSEMTYDELSVLPETTRHTTTYITAERVLSSGEKYNLRTPMFVRLTNDESGNYATLSVTYNDRIGTNRISKNLQTVTGSNFPVPINSYNNMANQISATAIDSDADGYDDALAFAYDGRVSVYSISEIMNAGENDYVKANDSFTPWGSSQYQEGFLVIEAGDLNNKRGEELAVLAYDPVYYGGRSKFTVIDTSDSASINVIGNWVVNNSDNLPKIRAIAPVSFTIGNFVPSDPRKQIAFGILDFEMHENRSNYISTEIYALNYDSPESENIVGRERIGFHEYKNTSWRSDSFKHQKSMAAADMLGIGHDYFAFGAKIYVFNEDKGAIESVATYNLGKDILQSMVWTSGHFSDDFNDYTAVNISDARPKDGVKARVEGEEFILTHVDHEGSKFAVEQIQLVDIDNSMFVDVPANGRLYGIKGGVTLSSVGAEVLLNTSPMHPSKIYSHNFPSIQAFDATNASMTAAYNGEHSVNFSQPVLSNVMEPVPFYESDREYQNAGRAISIDTEYGSGIETSTTVNSGVGFSMETPVFASGISASVSKSTSYSVITTKTSSHTFSDEQSMDHYFILNIVPFDRYGYEVLTAPAEASDLIGTSTDLMIPRSTQVLSMPKGTYDSKNYHNGGKFYHYGHLFGDVYGGDLDSYPTRNELVSRYGYGKVFLSEGVNIHADQGAKVGQSVSIHELTEEMLGHETALQLNYSLGVGALGFGFKTEGSFSKGLETNLMTSSGKGLTFSSEVGAFQNVEGQPNKSPYTYGAFITAEKNPQGSEEVFNRGGFWVNL